MSRKRDILVEMLVWRKEGVPDSEKDNVLEGLRALGYTDVKTAIRAKFFQIRMRNTTLKAARSRAEQMAERLLANQVIERHEVIRTKFI